MLKVLNKTMLYVGYLILDYLIWNIELLCCSLLIDHIDTCCSAKETIINVLKYCLQKCIL